MHVSSSKTIAFVTPWHGKDCRGGAELYCAGLAQAVAGLGYRVEVLTTCCSSAFTEWSTNDVPEGTEKNGNITVRRFPVNNREARIFAEGWRAMDLGLTLSPDEQRDVLRHSITSQAMVDYIRKHQDEYLFCFLPYLYGTTVDGILALPPQTAILAPCLHDEPIARMDIFQEVFDRAKQVLFLSEPEMRVACELYSLAHDKMHLLGGGLNDVPKPNSSGVFLQKYHEITRPYMLCVGRKVPGKGADIIVGYYAQMHRDGQLPPELDLILIGEGTLEIPTEIADRVHSIRCESHTDVHSAMAGALVLIQPSLMESFSIVLMEAWLNMRSVIVNGACAVTRHHVQVSSGGLWFEDYPTFSEAILALLDSPSLRLNLAQNGRNYVRQNWLWHHVAERFRIILEDRNPI